MKNTNDIIITTPLGDKEKKEVIDDIISDVSSRLYERFQTNYAYEQTKSSDDNVDAYVLTPNNTAKPVQAPKPKPVYQKASSRDISDEYELTDELTNDKQLQNTDLLSLAIDLVMPPPSPARTKGIKNEVQRKQEMAHSVVIKFQRNPENDLRFSMHPKFDPKPTPPGT